MCYEEETVFKDRSHSTTMEELIPTRYKTAKIYGIEHTSVDGKMSIGCERELMLYLIR